MEIPLTGFRSVGAIDIDKLRNEVLMLRWEPIRAVVNGEGTLRFAGYRVHTSSGKYIGWVAKSFVREVKDYLNAMAGNKPAYLVLVTDIRRGEAGNILAYARYCGTKDEPCWPLPPKETPCSNQPKCLPPDQPATEQSNMRTPSIQEIVNANVNAASSAAKLEVGRVANDQLSKIIAARLPGQYGELLKTPIGQLALANAFAVASRATCPENKNIQTIVNMMTLDAYQQLFKLLDVPGIVAELMGNKVIAEALAQEAKDE